jgi:hypothetical protein
MTLLTEQKFARNVYANILFRSTTDIVSAATQSAINTTAAQIFAGTTTQTVVGVAASQSVEASTFVLPIVSLYQGLMHRAPDVAGLGYWVDRVRNGVSQSVVATQFAQSAEFSQNYGVAPTAISFLTKLYVNVLGRSADTDGFNYWLSVLGGGAPSLSLPTRAAMTTVTQAFTQSVEGLTKWTLDSQNWLFAGVSGSYPVSIGPITYTLTNGGAVSATEASIVNFKLTTINVAPGAVLNYTLTGVTSAQVLGGLLSGTTPVAADGTANIPITLNSTLGLGLAGSMTLSLISPYGAGVGSVLKASVTLVETTAVSAPVGSTIAINGTSASVFTGQSSPTVVNLTASQATLTIDQTGTSAANSMILNYNTAGLTLGLLTLGNGTTNSDPGVLSINNNMTTGVSTLTNLVDNAAVKGLTTIRVDDASAGSTTVIGAINASGLRTLDMAATLGTVKIGGVTPLSQNGLVIKLGTGADTVSIRQTTPSQVNADLISSFDSTEDVLNLGSTKILAGTDYATTVTVTNGFDTSSANVTTFLANLGAGKGTAGTAAFDDGVNTWIATVSATGLTNVVELVGITNLNSISGATGGTGGLNLSTLGGSTNALVLGGVSTGTTGNDTFTGTFGDGGGNSLGAGDTVNGLGGADTLIIGPVLAAASTFADGLWQNVSNIENLEISTGAGAITLVSGAFFNTAFSTGVNLTSTTNGGADTLNLSTFTGPASITAIAIGAGAQTITTGAGAASVSATAVSGAQTILGANLTSVSVTNAGNGAQTVTSTGSADVAVTAIGFSGAQVISTAGGADTLTVTTSTGTTNTFGTGGGNDVITLTAAGGGASTSNTITAGSGADIITLGTHTAGIDHLVNALGASGTFVRPATNTISTATFDVITGLMLTDTLQTSGNTLAAIVTGGFNLATSVTANGTAEVIRGTYSASAKTFVGAIGGLDSLLVVDASAGGTGVLEATVLVGITGFTGHTGTNFFTV